VEKMTEQKADKKGNRQFVFDNRTYWETELNRPSVADLIHNPKSDRLSSKYDIVLLATIKAKRIKRRIEDLRHNSLFLLPEEQLLKPLTMALEDIAQGNFDEEELKLIAQVSREEGAEMTSTLERVLEEAEGLAEELEELAEVLPSEVSEEEVEIEAEAEEPEVEKVAETEVAETAKAKEEKALVDQLLSPTDEELTPPDPHIIKSTEELAEEELAEEEEEEE